MGVTNQQLARHMRTTEATVSRWRSGVIPRESARRKIARRLDTSEAALGWTTEEAAA